MRADFEGVLNLPIGKPGRGVQHFHQFDGLIIQAKEKQVLWLDGFSIELGLGDIAFHCLGQL